MNTGLDNPGEQPGPDGDDRFDEALRAMASEGLPDEVKQKHLRMLAGLPDRRHPPRMRQAIVLAVAVMAFSVAGLGTAAALGVFSAPVTDRSIAHCYATTDPDGAGNHFDITVADEPGATISERDAADIALDICRGAWQQGRLSAIAPHISDEPQPGPWTAPVPPLAACMLDNGQVAIFPGGPGSCRQMGLPVAEQ